MFWQFFVIAQLLYLVAQLAAKISVALVLYRIATMAPLVRKILIASMAIMSVVSVVAIFIFGFQCRPLSVAWGVGTGTCLPGSTIANTAYAVSAADILFSWLYGVRYLVSNGSYYQIRIFPALCKQISIPP